jgi:hypothetical protein
LVFGELDAVIGTHNCKRSGLDMTLLSIDGNISQYHQSFAAADLLSKRDPICSCSFQVEMQVRKILIAVRAMPVPPNFDCSRRDMIIPSLEDIVGG